MSHSFDLVGTSLTELQAWCAANLRQGFIITEIVPPPIYDNGFMNIGPEIAGQMTIRFVFDGSGPEFRAAWKPGHERVGVLIEDDVDAVRFELCWCETYTHRKTSAGSSSCDRVGA